MSRSVEITTRPRGECACPRLATTPQTMCSVCRKNVDLTAYAKRPAEGAGNGREAQS